MNMKELSTENTGADRIITEKQNVRCLPRPFHTFGLLDRTANAKAEESKSSEQIIPFD
jgi:hypothetical protein